MLGTFTGPFARSFPQTSITPWWLSGGIPAANCVAAYQPKGAESLNASYVNLANPGTYDAVPVSAPMWDVVSGWIGDGSSYLSTGVIPASGWSAIVRYSDAISGYLFGETQGGAIFTIEPMRSGTSVRYFNGNGSLQINPNLPTAILGFAGNVAYRNGIAESGVIPTWIGTAVKAFLLGLNTVAGDGAGSGGVVAKIQAIAFYNLTLSPSQMLSLYTAMNAL